MIDPKSKLTIFHDDNGVFNDLTEDLADFTRDSYSLSLISGEDCLYVGYHKPFNTFYLELFTVGTVLNVTFTVKVWNGSSWVVVDSTDETKGFLRSGYFTWDKASMNSTTVNGLDKYYICIEPSTDQTAVQVRGLNLIFANDIMMKTEFFEIDNQSLLPAGEVSHIGTHVATRNYILHYLRNYYTKQGATSSVIEKINQFDLIDIFEIREAAVYLSLSKIFFNLSDSTEDNYWTKYREYQDKYEEKITTARLSIDLDDDGVDDVEEVQAQRKTTRWAR